jgi:hypothetical protein
MASKVMLISPLTGQLTTYLEHSALMTCQQTTAIAPESLKTLMNSKISEAGYDAFVDDIKVIQGSIDTNVSTHLWVAETQPAVAGKLIGPFVVLALLVLIVGVVATIAIIASTAQTIIEHFWPQAKFYQVDVQGNQIVVNSLAEYITCQQAAHPNEFVCHYCGQVFATEAERDAHETTCPWKSGVPGVAPSWAGIVIIGVGAVVLITSLWVLAKVFGKEKGPPIIVTR